MLKKLNGWQRLWIVLNGLYLFPILLFTIDAIPKASNYNNTRLHDSIDLVGKYMESTTPGYIYEGSFTVKHKYYNDLSDAQILDHVHTKFKDTINFANVETEFKSNTDNLRTEQAKTIFYALLWWFIPSGFLYLLGVSVAWVIRGFRSKKL